jgi:L-ascorbate metabolism protein UlaG (beta-lactamase superfamily)
MSAPIITLIGGPTALIEANGFRLLTDPTFDPPGEYQLPHVILKKIAGPARMAAQIGQVDAVLLSHDQHPDNFDHAGTAYAMGAPRLITTLAGAHRLGAPAEGLAPWQGTTISKQDGSTLQITATLARHGPAGIEPLSGDVIGFVVTFPMARCRFTSRAIRSGMMAWPRWRAAFDPVSCFCSPARPAHAVHSISL